MIIVRRGADRGQTKLDWLNSHHTFSFGQYYDPAHSGFRTIRVLNEDKVRPEGGFATHPHRDMEILTYVLEGTLEHRDSLGTQSKIKKGELQLMSAGKGVQHSEFNPSEKESVHFLQIWIVPKEKGLEPSYAQKLFLERERKNTLRLVVSPTGIEDSLKVHQDLSIYLGHLEEGKQIDWQMPSGRAAWIQVTRGKIKIGTVELHAGDGASFEKEKLIQIQAESNTEFLLFDVK